jgi:LEA14-like dessication related protein
MKKALARIGIFILIITIVTGGCFFILRTSIINYFIPEVEQIGDINIKVKNDTSYISSKLVVKNGSFLKIEIDTLKYKISLFNKVYLQSEQFIGAVLPKHGKDTLDFSLKIPYLTILKDMKAERKKGDSASYSANISLQFSTLFGKAEIPINKTAKLKIPEPPELEVVEIKWKKIRRKSIYANAKIKIINNSPVTLSIKDMSYSMEILKQGDLKGSYDKSINIKPNELTYVDLPIMISVDNIGKTIFDMMINRDNYNYTLNLNAILESTDPITQSFRINITQTGKVELKK